MREPKTKKTFIPFFFFPYKMTTETAYSVFVPDFEQPSCTLISSTLDRYNDTIKNSLEKDLGLIQQKVNLSLQADNNNFYRNAKW